MKRFSEQLKKKSETVRLRASEKRDLKARLVSYMEYHPMPKSASSKITEAEVSMVSEEFKLVRFNTASVRGFFGAFAVFILILVPVVAERAVPGDVLYPVKVQFNEEIRSTLAVSPYATVAWETERLERRIAEARLLASEGKLTEEAEADVAAAVKLHSDAAQAGIAEIRESDSDEAAIAEITFASALAVQSEVLEGALEKEIATDGASTTPDSSVAVLAGVVEDARKNAEEHQVGEAPSYEKLIARMELETTRAYELFESVKEVASEEEVSDVERRLGDVERKIAEAASLYGGEDVTEEDVSTSTPESTPEIIPEIELLRTALSDLQKLISFMTDIDVRDNVVLEELVPVTLTDEEYKEFVVALHAEIDSTTVELTTALETREIDERTEKLEVIMMSASELASSSKVALTGGNLTGAETNANETLDFLNDAIELIGTMPVSEPVVGEEVSTSTESTIESEEASLDSEEDKEIIVEETGTTTEEMTEEVETTEEGI